MIFYGQAAISIWHSILMLLVGQQQQDM